MARKQRPGWQERRPRGTGPRLLDGEVPDGRPPGTEGVFASFSWGLALAFLGLGLLAALAAQYAC